MRKRDKIMCVAELRLISKRLREIAEKIKDDPDFGHFELDIVGNCEDEPDPESRAGLEYIANKIERTIES